MKRSLIIFIIGLAFIGAAMTLQYRPFGGFNSEIVDVREVSLNKHTYVVASMRGIEKGGVSIIHSESCPCKSRRR